MKMKHIVISSRFNQKLATWIENTYSSCEGRYYPDLSYPTVQELDCILDSGTSEYARKALFKYMRTIQYSGCIN